jgi:hypothetical protein
MSDPWTKLICYSSVCSSWCVCNYEIRDARVKFPYVTISEVQARYEMLLLSLYLCRMAQAVSSRPLIAEARILARVSPVICGGQIGTGTGFSPSFSLFPVIIIPPWLFVLIFHWGMNSRPVGGHGSETYSHPIDMKNNISVFWKLVRKF